MYFWCSHSEAIEYLQHNGDAQHTDADILRKQDIQEQALREYYEKHGGGDDH
jgi:hypothetical protein